MVLWISCQWVREWKLTWPSCTHDDRIWNRWLKHSRLRINANKLTPGLYTPLKNHHSTNWSILYLTNLKMVNAQIWGISRTSATVTVLLCTVEHVIEIPALWQTLSTPVNSVHYLTNPLVSPTWGVYFTYKNHSASMSRRQLHVPHGSNGWHHHGNISTSHMLLMAGMVMCQMADIYIMTIDLSMVSKIEVFGIKLHFCHRCFKWLVIHSRPLYNLELEERKSIIRQARPMCSKLRLVKIRQKAAILELFGLGVWLAS